MAQGSRLQLAKQVHGSSVARASGWDSHDAPEADAVISADPSFACAVRTADCAPVLLACTATGAVAAIHAGWRGIAEGVIPAAVGAMVRELGAQAETMIAAVGPCARARRYEIGEEVAAAVSGAGCAAAVIRRPESPRPFLDVARAAALQLAASGIAPGRIDADPPCSIESAWCPSHRRDPSNRARMLSLIAPRLMQSDG
jgi:YfiH family protein